MPRKTFKLFSRTFKQNSRTFQDSKKNPGLFQNVETLERAVLSESLTHFNLRFAWSSWAHYIPEPFLTNANISTASFFYNIFNYTLQHGQL